MEEKKEEIVEKKKVNVVVKEDEYDIVEYCSIKGLEKYHVDAFKMIFGMEKKRTLKGWTDIILKDRLIKEDLIK